jgi:subtilisin family serine protease
VINISEGYPDLRLQGHVCLSVQTAVAYAAQKDAVVVASAGNSGNAGNRLQWPADCPGVLAVGAIDGKKIPWTNSQRQPYVSVAAPGIQIGSVFKGHVGWNDRRYAKANGTSDAAALASGAIALVRAKNPNLTARQVVQRVINTAVDAGPPGRDVYTGAGAMIPYRSMTQDVPASAPNPPYAELDKYLAAHHQLTLPTSTPPSVAVKKSATSPLLIAVIVGVVVLVIIVVIGLLLARRRRGGGRPAVQQQPFPGPPGPGQFPPGPGGYGPQQVWGSQRPVAPPPGPPSSFLPPQDRGRPEG